MQYAFRTVIELSSLTKLEKIAAERGDDVTDLVTRAIDALSNEPILLANLIEEDEDKPQPRGQPRNKIVETVTNDDQ